MSNPDFEAFKKKINPDATILDASETNGIYPVFLKEYKNIDLVAREEVDCIRYRDLYRKTIHKDISEFYYDYYDVVLFGYALNNMDDVRADKTLEYAKTHAKLVIIGDYIDFPEAEAEEQPVKKPATRKRVKKDEKGTKAV